MFRSSQNETSGHEIFRCIPKLRATLPKPRIDINNVSQVCNKLPKRNAHVMLRKTSRKKSKRTKAEGPKHVQKTPSQKRHRIAGALYLDLSETCQIELATALPLTSVCTATCLTPWPQGSGLVISAIPWPHPKTKQIPWNATIYGQHPKSCFSNRWHLVLFGMVQITLKGCGWDLPIISRTQKSANCLARWNIAHNARWNLHQPLALTSVCRATCIPLLAPNPRVGNISHSRDQVLFQAWLQRLQGISLDVDDLLKRILYHMAPVGNQNDAKSIAKGAGRIYTSS